MQGQALLELFSGALCVALAGQRASQGQAQLSLPRLIVLAESQRGSIELGRLVVRDLANAGIPVPAEPSAVFSRRLPQAYPIYLNEIGRASCRERV